MMIVSVLLIFAARSEETLNAGSEEREESRVPCLFQ